MTLKIQQGYYQQARNPSDNSTLIELATELGLNIEQFKKDLVSVSVEQILKNQIHQSRRLRMNSFPSLAVENEDRLNHIKLDYFHPEKMLIQI